MTQKILCVLNPGHGANDPGAVNKITGITEHKFNSCLAVLIKHYVQKAEIKIITQTTLKTLPDDINKLNPHFIISLHCNGHENKMATGTEILYLLSSVKGKQIAEILLPHLTRILNLPNREIKGIIEDRGAFILKKINRPCILCESFFITNDNDFWVALINMVGLAKAFAAGIDEIATNLYLPKVSL